VYAFRRESIIRGIRLKFPGIDLPAATTEELPEAYLIRLIEKFVAVNNWQQVREALETYRTLFSYDRAPAWLTADIEACTAYLAARNLDLAQQYPAAVASYRRALRNTGRFIPVEAIGARLTEIKKINPEALAETPSDTERFSPGRTGFPGNLHPGFPPQSQRMPDNQRPPAPTGPQSPTSPPPATNAKTVTP
jgi:hypothetical protein